MNAGYAASKNLCNISADTVEKRIAQTIGSLNSMDVKVSMEQHNAGFPVHMGIPIRKMLTPKD